MQNKGINENKKYKYGKGIMIGRRGRRENKEEN